MLKFSNKIIIPPNFIAILSNIANMPQKSNEFEGKKTPKFIFALGSKDWYCDKISNDGYQSGRYGNQSNCKQNIRDIGYKRWSRQDSSY